MSAAEFPNLALVEPPRPDLAAAPGQFFLVTPPTFDPYLPRAAFPFRMRGEFTASLLAPPEVKAWAGAGALSWRGPFGRGFRLPPDPQRVLALAPDAGTGAHLIACLDALVARECEVTFICGSQALTERWLPPEVEYRIAEDALAAAGDLWSWADALVASGSAAFCDRLVSAARTRRWRLDSGWGQILVRDVPLPCGVGLCYACARRMRSGLALTCRDGPVFDLADWIVEA